MRIIITESQKRMIILENIGEDLGSIIKQNVEGVKTLISKAQKQLGTSLQFLLTWLYLKFYLLLLHLLLMLNPNQTKIKIDKENIYQLSFHF